MDTLATLGKNIQDNFQALSPAQRMGLVALLAFGLAAIPVLLMMGQEPDMVVLYSQLEEEDVQAIVGILEGSQVPYKVTEEGGTILVPADKKYALKNELAGQGLPEGKGVGFELFDQSGVGMSEFAQKINFRRALQGELGRTISQMPEIQRARVHLVIPERRLFSTDREPARAAVVVTLRRGESLGPSQIRGIVHLVTSSVEGLQANQVTVVDGRGQLLSQHEPEGQAKLTNAQVKAQREMEDDLSRRIESMLDRVLGRNKSVVRVSANMDFRQVEVTEERYDPEGQVVRSEQRSQEKVEGEKPPGGVPGSRSNVPGEAIPNPDGGGKNAKRKSETINYEVNRKVSRIVEPTGTIKRLTVAVLVDGTYAPVVDEQTGETSMQYVPRTEEEMAQLIASIKTAVGFSEERGDQIEVVNQRFEQAGEQAGEEGVAVMVQDFMLQWGGLIKPLVFFLLGLLVLLMVVKPLVKSVVAPRITEVPSLPEGLPLTVGELEDHHAAAIPPEETALQLATENPQAAAIVIKEWMKEEAEVNAS